METEILRTISKHSIFSFEDIKECYDVVRSYDIIVDAIEFAPMFGVSLVDACKQIYDAS